MREVRAVRGPVPTTLDESNTKSADMYTVCTEQKRGLHQACKTPRLNSLLCSSAERPLFLPSQQARQQVCVYSAASLLAKMGNNTMRQVTNASEVSV